MKLFDPRAALAEIEKQGDTPATSATSATQRGQNRPNVAKVADVAALPAQNPQICKMPNRSRTPDMRHGFAVGGSPKTWTGNIVSLTEWRRLSEWEKHGPDGRHWNGITKQWERPK